MKESILIKKCRKRNRAAQKEMVERYSDDLFNLCIRYVRDENLASDCLQETWIQIFWNLDKYKEEGKWESWIKMIAINKCKEILRKEGRWNMEELSQDIIVKDRNREDLIIEEETVNNFLNSLSQRYRMVVNLYLVEEYSHKEIAEFLEITESSSRSLLSRALKMLRDAFKEPELERKLDQEGAKVIRRTIFKQAII